MQHPRLITVGLRFYMSLKGEGRKFVRTGVRLVYVDRAVEQVLTLLRGDTLLVALSIKGEIIVFTSRSDCVCSMC